MNSFYDSLSERLKRAGIMVAVDAEAQELDSPWYIKALLALAGWVAAIFILGFLSMGFNDLLESSVARGLLGLVMIACAFVFLHITKSDFAEHLMLAASLAGQLLVASAIGEVLIRVGAAFWWYLAFMHIVLAAMMPHFVHRVFSAFAATVSVALAMSESGAPYLTGGLAVVGLVVIWLHEFRYPNKLMLMHAIGYGVMLGLLTIQGLMRFELMSKQDDAQVWFQPWMGEVIAGVGIIYLIWHLFQRAKQTVSPSNQSGAYASAILLCLASFQAYGLTQGLVILILGFAISNRVLLGLGIVSLLFSISSYYYLLDITLLAKAQTLLVLGLLLLASRELMNRLLSAPAEEHSDA